VAESHFESKDHWPVWLWLFLLFLTGSLAFAVDVALGNRLAWSTFLLQVLLIMWASMKSPLEISVDEKVLRVGSALIERDFLGEVTSLSAIEMTRLRGRDADPRAWLAIRFWVSTGVKIEICDPADPTPYWLVSAKRAHALADALS